MAPGVRVWVGSGGASPRGGRRGKGNNPSRLAPHPSPVPAGAGDGPSEVLPAGRPTPKGRRGAARQGGAEPDRGARGEARGPAPGPGGGPVGPGVRSAGRRPQGPDAHPRPAPRGTGCVRRGEGVGAAKVPGAAAGEGPGAPGGGGSARRGSSSSPVPVEEMEW